MPMQADLLTRARAYLQAHAEEMAGDLSDFTRIPSVSRADLASPGAPFGPEVVKMLNFALLRGAAYGFETKNGDGFYGKITLGDDDNAIGMIAHADVVPEGVNWLYPPYGAYREGDFLFGRGSQDNKASLVACLYVMRMVKALEIPLAHGLRLILGCSEETGMQDMVAYNQMEKPCEVTLVPDSAFPVCYAQKGSLAARVTIDMGAQIECFSGGEADNMVPPLCRCVLRARAEDVKSALDARGFRAPEYEIEPLGERARITARGAAAHAAMPEGGVSAIHMLSSALEESGLLGGDSQKAMRAVAFLSQGYYGEHAGLACEDADSGKTTMVVGIARTQNTQIELHVDCRLCVTASVEGARAAMRDCARNNGFALTQLQTTPPVFIPKDDARVEALQNVYATLTGDTRAPYAMGGGTYSRCLSNAITFGISLPGRGARPEGLPQGHGGAHGPDEFVHLPSLMESTLIYLCAVVALDAIV